MSAPKQYPAWLLPPSIKRRPFKQLKPVPMPTKMPKCFSSIREWRIYKVLAQLTGVGKFNYCEDCTAEYRDRMHAEGRCAFPGTKFVRRNGVIVGRRAK